METIVGFVAGYLVGTREGREGLERLRSSLRTIRTSPEVRKLAGEAVAMAGSAARRAGSGRSTGLASIGGVVSGVTEALARRAGARLHHAECRLLVHSGCGQDTSGDPLEQERPQDQERDRGR